MEIRLVEKAAKQLDRIPEPLFSRLKIKIGGLTENPFPSGAKRLVNWPGFRLRVGDYRILYEVDQGNKVIIVYRVAHRRDVYRGQ